MGGKENLHRYLVQARDDLVGSSTACRSTMRGGR
jgi:hypothetical protein